MTSSTLMAAPGRRGARVMPGMTARLRAWCLYDWANSVYSLVIATTIFPIYYQEVMNARLADQGGRLAIGPLSLPAASVYSYTLTGAFLLVALGTLPLSALADRRGWRLGFLQAFCYAGAAATGVLFFFTDEALWIGVAGFGLATVGFAGSQVFYNAYLPELSAAGGLDENRLSARGFAYGYVGSVILQVLCLLPILQPGWFGGIDGGLAARLAFLATGLWWAGFGQVTFRGLRGWGPAAKPVTAEGAVASRQAGSLWADGLAGLRAFALSGGATGRFIWAYLIYNMGVQTIMYLATLFGATELKLETAELIGVVLALQLVAIPGALLTGWLAGRFGTVPVLISLTLLWMGVCLAAYGVRTAGQFYGLAVVVGIGMGGIQSLSRAAWARLEGEALAPTSVAGGHDTDRRRTLYFSVLDLFEKLSIVGGTATFGLVVQLTGSMRLAALALSVLFLAGTGMLWRLRRVSALRPADRGKSSSEGVPGLG